MYVIAGNKSIDMLDTIGGDFDVLNVKDLLISTVSKPIEKEKKQNVRKDLLNELYSIYINECNKEYYVKNKKRYYAYIKKNHPEALAKHTDYKAHKDAFKTAKLPETHKYLKPYTEDEYQWYKRFNKLKQVDLREMISNARSMVHRKGNVIAYILSAGKLPVEKPLA